MMNTKTWRYMTIQPNASLIHFITNKLVLTIPSVEHEKVSLIKRYQRVTSNVIAMKQQWQGSNLTKTYFSWNETLTLKLEMNLGDQILANKWTFPKPDEPKQWTLLRRNNVKTKHWIQLKRDSTDLCIFSHSEVIPRLGNRNFRPKIFSRLLRFANFFFVLRKNCF